MMTLEFRKIFNIVWPVGYVVQTGLLTFNKKANSIITLFYVRTSIFGKVYDFFNLYLDFSNGS